MDARKMLHFQKKEYTCKCGCGEGDVNPRLLQMWNKVREMCGFPIVIHSGCRCSMHNRAEGGKDDSEHLTGDAWDVKAISSTTRIKIIKAMLDVGFTRIGVGKTFIHGGIGLTKPRYVMWLY